MEDTGNFALHRLQGRAQPPMLDPCVVERRVLVGVVGQLLPGRFQRRAVLPAQNIQRFPQAMALGQQLEKNRSRRPLFVQRDHVEKLRPARSSRNAPRRTSTRSAPDPLSGARHRLCPAVTRAHAVSAVPTRDLGTNQAPLSTIHRPPRRFMVSTSIVLDAPDDFLQQRTFEMQCRLFRDRT
jgi:hypothetical protein